MELDGELAKKLFSEGAVLVLLDVPERTEFGIDYNSWTVGPKFKGVKMIPPGFHFIYYSAVSKQGQLGPRTGFFHFFERREVLVKKWDPTVEDITDMDITAAMKDRIREDLQDLDRYLGPYPYDFLTKWVSLTNHITAGLVSRLEPLSGHVSSVTQILSEKRKSRPLTPTACLSGSGTEAATPHEDGGGSSSHQERRMGADVRGAGESRMEEGGVGRDDEGVELVESIGKEAGMVEGGVFAGVGEFAATKSGTALLPRLRDLDMICAEEAVLRFSKVPSKTYPEGATPAQISHHSMDLSFAMEEMMSKECNNNEMELLGELQFTFICFLIGQVYDAFEHWKELVKLMCFSEDALVSHKMFFMHFITVMHFQLQEIPEDFFVDIVSRNNFLTTTLQAFFSNLEESGAEVDRDLVKKGIKFKENLTKRYKWDFSSEPDDFAPTVVDLT